MNFKNILAIGAHPDDIEISCLGALLKLPIENVEKKIKKSLINFLKKASLLNDTQPHIIHEESLILGSNYTIQKWMNRYRKLENDFY